MRKQKGGDRACEDIASHGHVPKVSDEQVSPAISLAIAPNDENYKTESMASKSSNQSGSRNEKPNCYKCQYRRSLPGDAHSECVHPMISEVDRIVTGFALMSGLRSAAMKRLNVSGNPRGIKYGWFYWPLNYDPVWLETCDGFEEKL